MATRSCQYKTDSCAAVQWRKSVSSTWRHFHFVDRVNRQITLNHNRSWRFGFCFVIPLCNFLSSPWSRATVPWVLYWDWYSNGILNLNLDFDQLFPDCFSQFIAWGWFGKHPELPAYMSCSVAVIVITVPVGGPAPDVWPSVGLWLVPCRISLRKVA